MKNICIFILVLLIMLLSGCESTKHSINERKGLMLLKPQEFERNNKMKYYNKNYQYKKINKYNHKRIKKNKKLKRLKLN